MRYILFLLVLFLAGPAWAGPWLNLDPVRLSSSGTESMDVGEKAGPISALRLRIDGATVHLGSLSLIPVKGEPIVLNAPQILKSGESSGLLRVPGPATVISKIRLQYRVADRKNAILSVRLKAEKAQNATTDLPPIQPVGQ